VLKISSPETLFQESARGNVVPDISCFLVFASIKQGKKEQREVARIIVKND